MFLRARRRSSSAAERRARALARLPATAPQSAIGHRNARTYEYGRAASHDLVHVSNELASRDARVLVQNLDYEFVLIADKQTAEDRITKRINNSSLIVTLHKHQVVTKVLV